MMNIFLNYQLQAINSVKLFKEIATENLPAGIDANEEAG